MEVSCATNGRQNDSEGNYNVQPKKETGRTKPTVKTDQHALQKDGTHHV
jgi:hypothetical protein